jgi:hypothetical protein
MIADACQRWRDRRDSYRPAGEPFDPRAYEVAAIADDTTARAFVVAHHYAGTFPAARRRFGLYERRALGALVGVAVFSVPPRAEVLRPLPGGIAEGLELGRFVLLDGVRANAETWFLARCFDALRAEGFAGVVSFSDPFARAALDGRVVFGGHVGTIYQASSACYLGASRADTMLLLPDGRSFSRRALAKIRQRERGWRYAVDQLVAAGAAAPGADLAAWLAAELPRVTRTVRHPGCLKYAFALSRAARRALPASVPYPKLSRGAA